MYAGITMNVGIACRLCLRPICNGDFHVLDENIREMLEALLLNLSFGFTKDPVLCNKCAAVIQHYSDFKSSYVDIDDLPSSETHDQKTCRFCLKQAESECLDLYESKESLFIVETLSKHIPELNLYVTQVLLTCETCLDLLKNIHSFILTCLDVEAKIKKYIELEGTDDNGHIELNYVQEIKPKLYNEVSCVYPIVSSTESSCGILDTSSSGVKTEGFIKEENLDIEPKNEDTDIKIKQNVGDRNEDKNGLESKHYQCNFCPYQVRFECRLKRHMLIHTNPSKAQLHKCDLCEFASKRKDTLKQHMKVHKDHSEIELFQCHMCPFVSKRKGGLKDHRLTHQQGSEVQMHKCEVCSFQSKHKKVLTRHLQVHKSPAETTMYDCEMCSYKTNMRFNLKRHMIYHKSPSEVTMYMCDVCAYSTKLKGDLKRHMIYHKNPSEATMYTCDACEFKTMIKWHLTRHMVVHKDPADVTMLKCDSCEYETRYKRALKMHMLVHKDPSQLVMFKCTLCTYEAKVKCSLNKHMRTHQKSLVSSGV